MTDQTVEQLYVAACETGQKLKAAWELVAETEHRLVVAKQEAEDARKACESAETADWAVLRAWREARLNLRQVDVAP
jgi:hypothetical protein